ncbi:MAG: hypothetical protein J0M16_11450 [Gammaproteobacteria bacterium]|jgi:hypothetical protein|nr:hypothetical protein [Gammaproteobacteria bacterium]
MKIAPLLQFGTLPTEDRRRVFWALFWRQFVVGAIGAIALLVIQAPLGWLLPPLLQLLGVGNPGIAMTGRIIGMALGLCISAMVTWGTLEWWTDVTIKGYELRFVRRPESASVDGPTEDPETDRQS